jgi:hypothetical protein
MCELKVYNETNNAKERQSALLYCEKDTQQNAYLVLSTIESAGKMPEQPRVCIKNSA